jgi:hypothetical protein
MTSGKNYNLQTKTFRCKGTTGSCVAIGGAVPTGMKRYVTFISVRPTLLTKVSKGSKIWFCSAATSQATKFSTLALASAAKKFVVRIPSATAQKRFFAYPESGPDPENPLFSVAESKFLTAQTHSTTHVSASCAVFVQYYDA